MNSKKVLLLDAVINLILGILLLAFSQPIIKFLGVPNTDQYFYPNILGGVLFGIGIALLIECTRKNDTFIGLGFGGAIAINLCGGIVLALTLIFRDLAIPAGGRIFLWILVIILVGISTAELSVHRISMKRQDNKNNDA